MFTFLFFKSDLVGLLRYECQSGAIVGHMGLSRGIVVGGALFAPPTTRPSFETAHFAGSKSCPQRSSPIWPEIAEFGTASNFSVPPPKISQIHQNISTVAVK